jgi:predicted Zn-dependent protease
MAVTEILKWGLLVMILGAIGVFWYKVPLPCERPLHYSLGTFDSRFNLSRTDFLQEVAQAETVWEKALGKELFQYDETATFHVNLIFDTRQEQTIEAGKLEDSLQKTENATQNLNATQGETLALYQEKSKEYERLLQSFKKQLDAYNAEVAKWNKQGGAPPEEYKNLQKVAASLEEEQRTLEKKRQEVNTLARQVNAVSAQKVALTEQYNDKVQDYVERYGESGEAFDQGVYTGKDVNIYQYEDQAHLEAVLVHELGHALGLAHGSDPRSIMYPLMKDQSLDPLTLTAEDKTMLQAQCNQTVWENIGKRFEILRARFASSGAM